MSTLNNSDVLIIQLMKYIIYIHLYDQIFRIKFLVNVVSIFTSFNYFLVMTYYDDGVKFVNQKSFHTLCNLY